MSEHYIIYTKDEFFCYHNVTVEEKNGALVFSKGDKVYATVAAGEWVSYKTYVPSPPWPEDK